MFATGCRHIVFPPSPPAFSLHCSPATTSACWWARSSLLTLAAESRGSETRRGQTPEGRRERCHKCVEIRVKIPQVREIFHNPGASCCGEAYWLEAPGEIEEIPGAVIWMLKAISSCLMLALFGCLAYAFPSLPALSLSATTAWCLPSSPGSADS